jgi:hypothetical protein
MVRKYDPQDVFEEIKNNFKSIETFDKLVQSSALYYQEYGLLDVLKLFIPNNNNYDCLNQWTTEKAETAANDVIRVFMEQRISNAYLKEIQQEGIYLAFQTRTSVFLSYSEYIGEASYIIGNARNNGVSITADEWLRDFPYEFHAAWYNRTAVSEEIAILLKEPENEILAQALYDGKQNWLENFRYPEIDNWSPTSKFIEVFQWDDTEDEKQQLTKEFRKNYN